MKVTIKGIVHKDRYSGDFLMFNVDMSEYGHLPVGPAEFEFDVPESFNPVQAEIATLNKKLDTLADEYHGKVAQIKGRINDLLCLEAPEVKA